MRNTMSHEEFRDHFEDKEVKPNLEDGHSGKTVVSAYERNCKKHKVKYIGENDDA